MKRFRFQPRQQLLRPFSLHPDIHPLLPVHSDRDNVLPMQKQSIRQPRQFPVGHKLIVFLNGKEVRQDRG